LGKFCKQPQTEKLQIWKLCLSQVTKLYSLQLFRLTPFGALTIYTWLGIIWGEKKLSMSTCDCVV
jgi:hypothetical protein